MTESDRDFETLGNNNG